jgi:hypothetical protein
MAFPVIGLGLSALRFASPYIMRGGKALINPSNLKNYFFPKGGALGAKKAIQGAVQPGKSGLGFLRSRPTGIFNPSFKNIGGQTAVGYGGYKAYDYLTDEAEQSADTPPPAGSGGPVDTVPDPIKPKDKKEKPNDAKITSDQIKSGELDDFIKERIDLFKKYIGDDTRKRTKTAGYNAMVQFGLNLATKRGNLVEGIAESAKEPLKEFAKLGNDLMDRAASIEKAGIESGVSAYEKAEDRKIDEKAIEADILQEKIKQQARTLSRGEFITTTKTDIMGNEKLFNAITASRYDKDGNLIENAPSEEALIDQYAENLYNTYRAVELPPGQAGADLLETLPGGTMYYNPETGEYAYKQ